MTETEIVRIILRNSPDAMTEDDAEACGVRYRRVAGETVAEFRERAATDAEARGCASIVFGASEDEDCQCGLESNLQPIDPLPTLDGPAIPNELGMNTGMLNNADLARTPPTSIPNK